MPVDRLAQLGLVAIAHANKKQLTITKPLNLRNFSYLFKDKEQ